MAGLPAMGKDQSGQSVLTTATRLTPRVEIDQHITDSVLTGASCSPSLKVTGHYRAGSEPPSASRYTSAGAVLPSADRYTSTGAVLTGAGRCAAGAASTVLQEGSTGALPPDKVRLLLHTLGSYLGVQTPLPGSQEDTLPGVQQTSPSHENLSGTPWETMSTATQLGGV